MKLDLKTPRLQSEDCDRLERMAWIIIKAVLLLLLLRCESGNVKQSKYDTAGNLQSA
jgi:hypothetical protein